MRVTVTVDAAAEAQRRRGGGGGGGGRTLCAASQSGSSVIGAAMSFHAALLSPVSSFQTCMVPTPRHGAKGWEEFEGAGLERQRW